MSPTHTEAVTALASTARVAAPTAEHMAHERCDTCGHRAYVMVMTAGGPLAFCAHHFQEDAVALTAIGAVIHDLRDQLAPTNRTMH